MRPTLFPAACLIFLLSCGAALAAWPAFDLVNDTAGGQLTWSGHTVAPCINAPVLPADHLVEDVEAKVLSLGLHWRTEPDATTGECLSTNIFWRIPLVELTAPRYIVSVERVGPDEMVFTLCPATGVDPVVKSPVCRLQRAFFGKFEDLAKHMTLIDVKGLFKELAEETPPPVSFEPPPQVWSSLRDEFVKEVKECDAWLAAPVAGLEAKFVFHAGNMRELSADLSLPETDVVVPLGEEAMEQLLALLRDDTPVKVSAKQWAGGGAATLNEALRIFTVTVVFEKQEYRYSIDPLFGFVDVSIGDRVGFNSENPPLCEKFVELAARQMQDERIKAVIEEARRRFCPVEVKK